MTIRRPLALALLLAAAPAASWPAAAARPALDGRGPGSPVTVSPGHPSRLARVAARCPTFSWGQVAEAERYELVVYRVKRAEDAAPVVVRATIDGRAGSWTPPLGRCLERGGRYAWSLRARRGEAVSGWSPAALFEVAPGPSAAALDEALAVVREHAAAAAAVPPERTPPAESADAPAGVAGESVGKAGDPVAAGEPGAAAFRVGGRIEAGSFAGDGAGLAGVVAAGLDCAGCLAGGELADAAVTAAKIGEPCAAGQVLMRGAAGWQCATLAAPACAPGDQVGCYTGPAGTLGVGECAGGNRTCAADSTWGGCAGEVTPAAELCDGLDNSCDGAVDGGDPAELCPPTANVVATLCEAAACAITACAELWADADGDYANGCEAPAPGACLENGGPRPIAGPGEGEMVIREVMANPAAPLGDAAAEWFEVAVLAGADLNGLGLGTTFGTVIDTIDAANCLPVASGEVLLFARSADPAVNGGLTPDHLFGFSLVNGGSDLHLAHGGNLVDAVAWAAGEVAAGRSRNLPPALEDAASNDDPASWCPVPAEPGLLYFEGNHGTPGAANPACP